MTRTTAPHRIVLDNGRTELYLMPMPDGIARAERREAERNLTSLIVQHIFGHDATLSHRDNGAPYVDGSDRNISVSHGAGMVLVGVDSAGPIGIDIEQWRDALLNVAEKILTRHEKDAYAALPDDMDIRRQWLLHAWTAKEALFKTGCTGADVISLIDTCMLPDDMAITRIEVDDNTTIAGACRK